MKQYIESIVIQHTMHMLQDEPLVERIVDTIFIMQAQKSTMLPLLKKQLAETKKAINNAQRHPVRYPDRKHKGTA